MEVQGKVFELQDSGLRLKAHSDANAGSNGPRMWHTPESQSPAAGNFANAASPRFYRLQVAQGCTMGAKREQQTVTAEQWPPLDREMKKFQSNLFLELNRHDAFLPFQTGKSLPGVAA